jgi:hypothetical protein
MPTFLVETNVTTDEFRQRVAKKVSLWLHHQNIQMNHVIMKFYELTPERTFSGPFPFDKFPGITCPRVSFAFVACQVAKDRPPEFLSELARKLVEAMQPEVDSSRAFISFQLVDPALHFVGTALQKGMSHACTE